MLGETYYVKFAQMPLINPRKRVPTLTANARGWSVRRFILGVIKGIMWRTSIALLVYIKNFFAAKHDSCYCLSSE